MFTGIITAIGTVRGVRRTPRGLRITIAAPYRELVIGESVAVDGACLTVIAKGRGTFSVEAIGTTRGRTKVDGYAAGTKVNLERALRAGDRLGGHLVGGHVDAVGIINRREVKGESVLFDISAPRDVLELAVPLGSIAVDGVSLTINQVRKAKRLLQVALISHTLSATTLGGATAGTRVHLETDLIGRFVRQLLQPYRARGRRE